MDPSLNENPLGTKAGFDLTIPFDQKDKFTWRVCEAPATPTETKYEGVLHALTEAGPMFFVDILNAIGSTDGRDVALELDELRLKGKLVRLQNGEYSLKHHPDGA